LIPKRICKFEARLDLLDGRVGGREPVELREHALPLGPLAAHHFGGRAGVDARDDAPASARPSAKQAIALLVRTGTRLSSLVRAAIALFCCCTADHVAASQKFFASRAATCANFATACASRNLRMRCFGDCSTRFGWQI